MSAAIRLLACERSFDVNASARRQLDAILIADGATPEWLLKMHQEIAGPTANEQRAMECKARV